MVAALPLGSCMTTIRTMLRFWGGRSAPRQWEPIFFGYRSWAGLRTLGRRWSDLIEAGLGCSQEVADRLVNAAVINGPNRSMDGVGDAADIVSEMTGVLARIPAPGDRADLKPGVTATLLTRHARLLSFIQAQALGADNP
jgi:hypothetical protein